MVGLADRTPARRLDADTAEMYLATSDSAFCHLEWDMNARNESASVAGRSVAPAAASRHGRTLVSMILGTFREMPGLCLHMNQAARLFGVKQATCAVVLEDLVAQGKLRRGADGQYVGGQLDRMMPGPTSRIPGQHKLAGRPGAGTD